MSQQSLSSSLEHLRSSIIEAYANKQRLRQIRNLADRGKSTIMNILSGGNTGSLTLSQSAGGGGDPGYIDAVAGNKIHIRNNPSLQQLS
jgi:hypothetical protein